MSKIKTVYMTSDNKVHASIHAATEHQLSIDNSNDDLVNRYLESYDYRNNRYSMNELGLWEVRGEDPNCDFGGHHHQPYICTYNGKFIDALKEAVKHGSWMTWGAGGSIKKIEPIKV